MKGRITILDASARRYQACGLFEMSEWSHWPTVGRMEESVAFELLRITPRFWSGAVVSAGRDHEQFIGFAAEILCLDGYPAHASVTTRLRGAVYDLFRVVEARGTKCSNLLLGVAWDSPRTWTYDCRYFIRRGDPPTGSAWIDESIPGTMLSP